MNAIDEWLDSEGAKRDAIKFKHALTNQLLNSNYGLASSDNWAKRYLYITDKITDKIYDTLGIKNYLNKVYGDPTLKFKNGNYIRWDTDLSNGSFGELKELFKAPDIVDLVNQIIRKEEEEMGEHRVEPGTIIVANPDYSVSNRDGFWVIGDKVEEFRNIWFMAYRIPDCKVSNFLALPKMQRVVQMDCSNWFSIKLSYLSNADSDDIPGWHYATRKEMEEIEDKSNHKFTCYIETELHTIVRLKFIRNKVDPGIAYTVFVHYNPLGELDHALNYKTWEELSSRLMYDISMLIYTGFDKDAVAGFSEVIHKAKRVVKYCSEFNKNNEEKTVKETTEMNGYKFMVPKGVFGSKVYIQAKDSDKITYAGTLTDMHLETASGCEMRGNVDFIVDDEPMEKLANISRGFIKNVVFHDPATIVEWKDGTKTVVQARDGEKFDPEKGLAMAISKKAMGNKRDYYHVFKHYLKKVSKDTKKK